MSKYLIFIAISLILLVTSISGTTVAVAFPLITSSFGASLILAAWVMSINQLASTATMPLAGKAADIFGRKLTIMVSLFLFTVGSLFCALAPNIQLLIIARVVQGIGSGGILPAATGIVAEEFPRSKQQMIGLFTSIFPIGQIIGPTLGGWMIDSFQWRSIFWFNVPLGVLSLLVSAFILRPGHTEKGQIDWTGAGLFTGTFLAFMIGLSNLGSKQNNLSWALTGLLFATAIGLAIAFMRHENHSKAPIIDLQVLKERPFMAANTYNFVLGAAVFGIMSFIPLYATAVYGMSTLQSGLILTPRSIGMMVASTVTSIFLLKWGYRWPIIIGSAAIALGLFLLGIEPQGTHLFGITLGSIVLLVTIMLLSGIGMGIAAPASNNACIELMPNRIATITGVRGMFRQSGGTIGIAITSLILHSIPDLSRGFTVVFFSLGVLLLAVLPVVFAIPKSPGSSLSGQNTSRQKQ